MLNILFTLTITGAVASIVGLFLPANGWRMRAIHAVYGLVIAILAVSVGTYQSRLDEIHQISRTATKIIDDYDYNKFSDSGFIQASLSFLEKHKDKYPDTYARALNICNVNRCEISHYNIEENDTAHRYGLNDVAGIMKGILRGLSDMSEEE